MNFFEKKEKLRSILFDQVQVVAEKTDRRPVFASVYGSQNYNCDTVESDVDAKMIVMPTFDDLLNSAQYSKVIEVPQGLADTKDIRVMFAQFQKGNINFLEILFSHYNLMSGWVSEEFDLLLRDADNIANCQPVTLLKATCGMAFNKIKNFERAVEKGESHDNKDLAHMYRLHAFLEDYMEFSSFRHALTAVDRNTFLRIKKGLFYNQDKATEYVMTQRAFFDTIFGVANGLGQLGQDWQKVHQELGPLRHNMRELVNGVAKRLIAKATYLELYNKKGTI